MQDGVMRLAVQLEEKGEGSNMATQLQSLQAAVYAYNVHVAVLDGIAEDEIGNNHLGVYKQPYSPDASVTAKAVHV